MRKLLALAAVIVAAAAVTVAVLREHTARPRYVFLICLDACRPDHMSCYGYGVKTTARIDELAAHGTVFEDAVTQAPWTTASVATILTSTFPCQHGAKKSEGTRMPYGGTADNFIATLGSLGYQTALFTGGIAIKDKVSGEDLTASALEWLGKNLDKRCLTVIHNYETHSPYVASPKCIEALDPGYEGPHRLEFADMDMLGAASAGRLGDVLTLSDADMRHIKALYDCQIMRADHAVGTLVDSLRAWKRLKQSAIIVFADHGEEFLEHGSIDHGQTVYDEVLKVPLIVYCPSLGTKPRRVSAQVGLIDIAPTIFDLLGLKKPQAFEGISLAPSMSSRFKASAASSRPCGLPANCLVAESIARRSERKALRCPPWKLIFDPFFGAVELYDLSKDPHETTNVIDPNPDVAARLTATLLVMEKYYPGGWCVAWRGPVAGRLHGNVRVGGGLVEALAHNFYPELDAAADSMVVAPERGTVRFGSTRSIVWKGVEVRMAGPVDATFNLSIPTASLGRNPGASALPLTTSPDQARVDRRDLRALFASQGEAGCFIYWLEPGSEPVARAARDKELKKQLKAIGYIE